MRFHIRTNGGSRRALSNLAWAQYIYNMRTPSDASPSWPLARIGIAVAIGVVLVAALVGWSMYGTTILFTYAQDGLAWCF
jgi:uncharacterized membrane protein